MIHNSSAAVDGNATELERTKELLEKVDEQMAAIYVSQIASKGKLIDGSFDKTSKKVKEMMDKETWLTAEEAKDMGFIDEVVENTNALTMNPFQNMQNIAAQFKNVPTEIKNHFKMEKENKKSIIQQIAHMFGFKAEISESGTEVSTETVTDQVAPIAEPISDTISPEQARIAEMEEKLSKIEQQIAEKTSALENLEAEILAKSTATYKAEVSSEKKVSSKYTQETIAKANAFIKSIMK